MKKEQTYKEKSEFISCGSKDVCSHILFGTAGYRPFHSYASLSVLDKDHYAPYLTDIEKEQLETYLAQTETDKSLEGINDHVIVLIGFALNTLLKEYENVHGVILNYDVRFLGQHYTARLARVLECAVMSGAIEKVIQLEEYASTPELSLMMKEVYPYYWGVHLTASHNPFWFTGIKIEDREGKAASSLLTDKLSLYYKNIYNEIMQAGGYELPLSSTASKIKRETHLPLYQKYVLDQCRYFFGDLTLEDIRSQVKASQKKVIIDPNWGEAIGVWDQILPLTVRETSALSLIHNDYGGTPKGFFSYMKPEPSLATLESRFLSLKDKPEYVIAHDPDADRVTVLQKCDNQYEEIPVDILSLLLLAELIENIKFDRVKLSSVTIATTLATSSMAIDYMRLHESIFQEKGISLRLIDTLPVGFKWFSHTAKTEQTEEGENLFALRKENDFLLVYEESGGLSTYLCEKDGILGGLLALVLLYKKDLLQEKQKLLDQFPYEVDYQKNATLLHHSSWDERKLGLFLNQNLQQTLQCSGDLYSILEEIFKTFGLSITQILWQEGLKIYAQNEAKSQTVWLVVRLSGTEPKLRFYIQTKTEKRFKPDYCSKILNLIENKIKAWIEGIS